MYDVIIIGAGPAGISASLYTKRANLETLILYQEESALEKTNRIENYYGFPGGMDGKQLYQTGIQQAEEIGVKLEKEEVISIQIVENGFVVQTEVNQYLTKSIVLATGNRKSKPNIRNIEDYEGAGVSYCAVCDGFFYRNKSVVVVGSGKYAISEMNELVNIANNITLLTNGEKPPEFRSDQENVTIDTKEIEAIQGEEKVEEVKFKDGTTLKTEGVFVAQGVAGSMEFAKKLGIITRKR